MINIFEKVHCLLLDKRLEQGHDERIEEEFAKYDIPVKFFVAGNGSLPGVTYDWIDVEMPQNQRGYPAFVKRPNSFNAFMCFKQIVSLAQEENVNTLLILEDDVTLTDDFEDTLLRAWDQLNRHDSAWEMFYLGANHTWCPTFQVDENLLRLNGSGCWHAVCLHRRVFDRILALPVVNPIDNVAARLIHPRGHSYSCWGSIAQPLAGYSYCEANWVDYRDFFKNKGC